MNLTKTKAIAEIDRRIGAVASRRIDALDDGDTETAVRCEAIIDELASLRRVVQSF